MDPDLKGWAQQLLVLVEGSELDNDLKERIRRVINGILNVFCTREDAGGGVIKEYEWDDGVQPICHVYLLEFYKCNI